MACRYESFNQEDVPSVILHVATYSFLALQKSQKLTFEINIIFYSFLLHFRAKNILFFVALNSKKTIR